MTIRNGQTITVYGEISKLIKKRDEYAKHMGVELTTINRWMISKKDWSIDELMHTALYLKIKGVDFSPVKLYRKLYEQIETLEEFKEYLPITYEHQAIRMNVKYADYAKFRFTHLSDIDRFKEMIKESTLFPINMKCF